MKGLIMVEFLQMLEQQAGQDLVDDLLDESNLESGGSYTAVGYYDDSELLELVGKLSERTGEPASVLVRKFGVYLFDRLLVHYPEDLNKVSSAFDLLASVDNHIHREVAKLYPDAILPQFSHDFPEPDLMTLDYSSTRPLTDLAEGLILRCVEYYGDNVELVREDIPVTSGAKARFSLRRIQSASSASTAA